MSSESDNELSLHGAEALSLECRIRTMLTVEAALAKALAKAGIISEAHADVIAETCTQDPFDTESLLSAGSKAGTPVVPLVKAVIARTRTRSEEAARFVHYGATSQDILDTAMVIQLKRVLATMDLDLARIDTAFSSLAEGYVNTPVLGRTLLQAGPPVSFGLKVAGWAAAIRRGRGRLDQAAQQSLCLQFGGAVGNLSSLGSKGMGVAQHLADELNLTLPDAPWHTQRDRLVNLASSTGIVVGSLGKIARDISLHAQSEVGELREGTEPGSGGSSAMPHKRNPVACMKVLSVAGRTPALVSSLLSAMSQEHERGLGGWQSEWPSLRDLFTAAMDAGAAMADIAENLEVDTARMQSNLDATREVVFSERLATALLPQLGRVEAQDLVADLVHQSMEQGNTLSQAAAENPKVQSVLGPEALALVFDVQQALGSSATLLDRLLNREDA